MHTGEVDASFSARLSHRFCHILVCLVIVQTLGETSVNDGITRSIGHNQSNPESLALFRSGQKGSIGRQGWVAKGDPDDRVVVSRDTFKEHLRGESFRRWRDFKEVLGPEARLGHKVGGEERLMSALSIAFVIMMNVVVGCVVALAIKVCDDKAPKLAGWAAFFLLAAYACIVDVYCHYAYKYPDQRLITNILFGLVPCALSAASYLLALLIVDMNRPAISKHGFDKSIFSRSEIWKETFFGRLMFLLAVLPGFAMSVHLNRTVSTGFEAVATHFDVLSLCLFVDVFRVVLHSVYLFLPEWSIGKSPKSTPGMCYIALLLCLILYIALARVEAKGSGVILRDRTKIHALACLTSYVFFPLSLGVSLMNLEAFFSNQGETRNKDGLLETIAFLAVVFVIAMFMLVVSVIFNAVEANLMGIVSMLFVVFYGAGRVSTSLSTYILVMILLSAFALCGVMMSSVYADDLRERILDFFKK